MLRPHEATLELPLFGPKLQPRAAAPRPLIDQLIDFNEFGQETRQFSIRTQSFSGKEIRTSAFVNEFWTSRQRAANALHEVSYRACFKPQLPRFFVERLTIPGDRVYDPFMGRGTTLLEAALLGRVPVGCDVNPLSVVLTRPRLHPPLLDEVASRLRRIDFSDCDDEAPEDLRVFYHLETLREISALKKYLLKRRKQSKLDSVDEWIEVVALNRLTG